MTAYERLLVSARGAGPFELVLRGTAGEHRFGGRSLDELEHAIGRCPPFTTSRLGEAVAIDGALGFVCHSLSLAVEAFPEDVPAVDKAARRSAERAAHELALARAGELLRGYRVTVSRPASLEHWRAIPVSEWPPLGITLAQDGTPILTDGNHRVSVARELGVRQLRGEVRTVDGVVERWVGM